MYLMTARMYHTPNDGFSVNGASFLRTTWLAPRQVQFQLIINAIIKITRRGTTVPLNQFVTKQPKKEHKLGLKIFLQKLNASSDGPEKSTETTKG